MALTRRFVAASPERIFAVLLDPASYGRWVPGASHVRGSDPHWPAPGAAFHHTQGAHLGRLRDHTEIVHVDPPRSIVLLAHARPVGVAVVTVSVRPAPGGARVWLREEPAPHSRARYLKPLVDPLLWLRNLVSLRRIARLAGA